MKPNIDISPETVASFRKVIEALSSAIGPDGDLEQWLRDQYPMVRKLPDGSYAALMPLMYTTSVILGCTRWGYGSRFCFEERERATEVLNALQSEDDQPTGWIARR